MLPLVGGVEDGEPLPVGEPVSVGLAGGVMVDAGGGGGVCLDFVGLAEDE